MGAFLISVDSMHCVTPAGVHGVVPPFPRWAAL